MICTVAKAHLRGLTPTYSITSAIQVTTKCNNIIIVKKFVAVNRYSCAIMAIMDKQVGPKKACGRRMRNYFYMQQIVALSTNMRSTSSTILHMKTECILIIITALTSLRPKKLNQSLYLT